MIEVDVGCELHWLGTGSLLADGVLAVDNFGVTVTVSTCGAETCWLEIVPGLEFEIVPETGPPGVTEFGIGPKPAVTEFPQVLVQLFPDTAVEHGVAVLGTLLDCATEAPAAGGV